MADQRHLERLPNWPTLLVDTIDSSHSKEFEWGKFDCCLFACDCIAAMTGFDPANAYRGTYSSSLGAARLIKRLGFDLSDVASQTGRLIGARPIDPKFAGRGDVSLVRVPDHDALGVHYGRFVFVSCENGLIPMAANAALLTWRI